MNQVLRVAWYCFRATFGRRWGGYLAIILLVGLVGGLAMGAIAGARRTQSSYPRFLASTNPSDLTVSTGSPNSSASFGSDALAVKIAHLPGVRRVRDLIAPTIIPLDADGAPRLSLGANLASFGSLDGEFATQDRLAVVRGQMAAQNQADEIVMTANAARLVGVHLGETVPLGFYTNAQTQRSDFGTPKVMPALRIRARLVGIVVVNDQVVQDDIDQSFGFLVVTPALLHEIVAISPAAGAPVEFGLQLNGGSSSEVPAVERELVTTIPPGSAYEFHQVARVTAQVELAVKPESIALGAFGAIAGLVALVLGAQAISRQLRRGNEDRRVLRALGAGPLLTSSDGLIGVGAAVVLGSALAFGVAVGLSPLAPLGPVRPVYPDPGIAVDWTVLGIGFAVLVGGLGAVAVATGWRAAPSRRIRIQNATTGGSSIVRGALSAGVSVAGAVGVRFALEPGRGRTAVPVRSALMGTTLAVTLLVGTFTFASGLHTLISRPALYGWNWTYLLNPSSDVPPQAITQLDRDPDVAAWSGALLSNVEIDGTSVPALVSNETRPRVQPPILSGHGLDAANQIVLGAATLAALHTHVGDTVTVTYGAPDDAPVYVPPTVLHIVGSATFPAVGFTSFISDHTSMGTGALLSLASTPLAFQRALLNPDPTLNGPEMVFVRLLSGVSAVEGRANLERIAAVANHAFATDRDPEAAGNTVTVLGVQRP
ncbi:MAG: hypothetical protein ABSD13_20645, partial [Candidatus Korobacteraceae bacterium]